MKEKRMILINIPLLILGSILIASVSAFIIFQPSNTFTIKMNQGILGNILEGQTINYDPVNTPSLNDVIFIKTTQPNVYLYFDTNLHIQSNNYATYQIIIKAGDTIPFESEHRSGDVIAILTLEKPDAISKVVLDVAGEWTFDFDITTTAKSVNSNQSITVFITMSINVDSV